MNGKEILKHSAWWALIPFAAISLINKAWANNNSLSAIAWAFFFIWSLTECIKSKDKDKGDFIIESILSIAVFIVLIWSIADLL